MEKIKSLLLFIVTAGQLVGVGLFFVNIVVAIYFYAFVVIAFITLMILLVIERINEKKEDDENDYRNY